MYTVFTTWRNWTKKRQQEFAGEKADNVLDSLAGFSLIFVNSLWWGEDIQSHDIITFYNVHSFSVQNTALITNLQL